METLLYLRLFNDKTVDTEAEIVGRRAATHELFNGLEQYIHHYCYYHYYDRLCTVLPIIDSGDITDRSLVNI